MKLAEIDAVGDDPDRFRPCPQVDGVPAHRPFGRTRGATAHQDDGWVIRADGDRGTWGMPIRLEELSEPESAREGVATLPRWPHVCQSIGNAEERWQVVLDARNDHPLDRGMRLDRMHPRGERCQDHDRLSAAVGEQDLQFVAAVEWIERHDDRPGLPCTQLGNDKLRAVREEEGDTIARLDALLQ